MKSEEKQELIRRWFKFDANLTLAERVLVIETLLRRLLDELENLGKR